ncbi:MAG: hypothetical protein AB7T38_02070 [Nitrospirales bacterium]
MEEISPVVTMLAAMGVATVAIFLWNLARAPFLYLNRWMNKKDAVIKMVRKENNALKEKLELFQSAQLKILFDPLNPSYSTPVSATVLKGTFERYRICIKNIGLRRADDITVNLLYIVPCPDSISGHLPIFLTRKDDEDSPDKSFHLNGTDSVFINVGRVIPVRVGGGVKEYFEFHRGNHSPMTIPLPLPNTSYHITIQVTSSNATGDVRTLALGLENGRTEMTLLPI